MKRFSRNLEYQQYQEAGVEEAETIANAENAACDRYEPVYTPFCDCETINCPHGCN